MTSKSSLYQIKLRRNAAEKGWKTLEENYPEAMDRCRKFLEFSPLDRLASNGKLKKLHGELTGLLQYDVTDSARVWFTVDRKKRIVYVEYAGSHP